VMGVVWLTLGTLAKGRPLAGILVPAPVLFTWIAGCIFLSKEIADWKNEGTVVGLDSTAKPGEQITTRSNKVLYSWRSLKQSLIINGLMLSTVFGPLNLTGDMLLNGIINSIFGIYAKLPVAYFIDQLYTKAKEAHERGEVETGRALEARARKWNNRWNHTYSILKNFHLLAVGGYAAFERMVQKMSVLAGIPHQEVIVKIVSHAPDAAWWAFMGLGLSGVAKDVYDKRVEILNMMKAILGKVGFLSFQQCQQVILGTENLVRISKKQ